MNTATAVVKVDNTCSHNKLNGCTAQGIAVHRDSRRLSTTQRDLLHTLFKSIGPLGSRSMRYINIVQATLIADQKIFSR